LDLVKEQKMCEQEIEKLDVYSVRIFKRTFTLLHVEQLLVHQLLLVAQQRLLIAQLFLLFFYVYLCT